MSSTRRFAAALVAALALLAGCAGGPAAAGGPVAAGPVAAPNSPNFPLAARDADFAKPAELPAFVRDSLGSFSTFTLSNGIPVVVKVNKANRIQHLSLILRGGSLVAKEGQEGLESLALQTMARGSKLADYEAIQALLDETSSSIGAGAAFEHSSFSLNTLDKYFGRLLPVWASCLVEPSFAEEDFNQVLSDAKLALKSKEQNPWSKTGQVVNDAVFAGHPYARTPEGTAASLAKADLAAAKAWYESAFSADRVFVVAVGDFEPAALRKELEAGIGRIPDRKLGPVPAVPPLPVPAASRLLRQEYPQSKGVGYLRGDFAAPSPTDPDFMATNVAMKMLSDLLFNVVRDKYGATYSPSAYIRAFGANYGSVAIFKTKVAAEVKGYIDEALASLARGQALSVDPTQGGGDEPRMPIAAALPTYKNLFLSEYYEKQQTNGAIAAQIAGSVLSSGDYRSYLLDAARVARVTPEEVSAALDKYLLKGKVTWAVLGSKDVVEPVREADFAGFALK